MKYWILMLAVFAGSVSAEENSVHNYAIDDNTLYGYEKADSSEMFTIYYLGEKDGAYQIVETNQIDAIIYQAEKNGTFATVYKYKRNKFRGRSMLKLKPNMVVTHAFLDAWNGRLKRLVDANGKHTWVNGHKGKVKTIAGH